MQIFEYTNKGPREVNQDFLLHRTINNDKQLFIVADGMGGYTSGDVAAKLVSESISDYVDAHFNELPPADVLRDAIVFSNDELSFQRYAYGGVQMGTVIVVLLLVGTTAYISWLGDSRIYQYRSGKLLFQTEDHSMLSDLRKIHFLKPEDIERYSAIVTRGVMGDDKLGTIEVQSLEVATGDTFFMCTDGIHKTIEPINLPTSEAELKVYLDENCDQFEDNYSLLRVII